MEYALYRLILRLMGSGEHIPIRRHRLMGLDVCDVTTDELDDIERETGDLGLDFQISQFCLTTAIAFLAATLSNPPISERVYTVFVVMIVIGFAIGLIFALKWWRGRGAFSRLIQKIRDRQVGPIGDDEHAEPLGKPGEPA